MGADRTETFDVIPVDKANRLREIGPVRQIEVTTYVESIYYPVEATLLYLGVDRL